MSDQKICPTCGTEYPLSERFCPRDGTALRSAAAGADLLGSVVADRYHILKKLGEGGMGTVYLAEHVKMGRKSALKVMNPGMNTDPDAIARFNREASNASRLSHPNICGIYDFGETPDGLIYLAMEFIEGESLSSLIEKGGVLPPARSASIIHQTSDALQVAHDAGIVHRDLKPDNIMVARNRDGTDLVKVVDFGIAKASSSDAQKVTKTGLVVGTPEYMSPEQLAGDKLDGRSDIYSLGLVAFNCLTGGLPFASESAQEAMIMRLTDKPRSLAEVKPDFEWPATLQATMDKALARDANERYQNASQFGREFAAAIADMPMTRAIEAGTQMLNAVAASKQSVPQTRVARPSSKTEAMEAPPPALRRPAPAAANVPAKAGMNKAVVLGGLGTVGIAAVALFVVLNKGVGAPATSAQPPNPTPTNVDSGKATGTVPPVDTGTKGKAPDPVPSRPPGNPTRPGTSTTPQPTPTGPSAMEQLSGWLNELNASGITATRARAVIGEIEKLRPNLTSLTLAESWFVEMIGYTALEDETGTCKAAREVKRLHTNASRLSTANTVIEACP